MLSFLLGGYFRKRTEANASERKQSRSSVVTSQRNDKTAAKQMEKAETSRQIFESERKAKHSTFKVGQVVSSLATQLRLKDKQITENFTYKGYRDQSFEKPSGNMYRGTFAEETNARNVKVGDVGIQPNDQFVNWYTTGRFKVYKHKAYPVPTPTPAPVHKPIGRLQAVIEGTKRRKRNKMVTPEWEDIEWNYGDSKDGV